MLKKETLMDNFGTAIESKNIVIARFICGIVLHMTLQEEIRNGMKMMKFALNHDYRFSDYKIAFLAGFL